MPCHSSPQAPQRRPRGESGLTLIELAIATAIVSILVGLALPSFQNFAQRQRLEGAAAQLETDLFLLRSEAVASQETLRISFSQAAGGSCYVIHRGAANACQCGAQGVMSCEGGAEVLRGVFLATAGGVQILSNRASLVVDATRGTVSPTATMRLVSQSGEIRHVINIMGRVRSCSPDGSVNGYRRC
jgi:type IV fimbrial biogenesis protein FimT